MIPYGLLFHRLTHRYQEDTMTCNTPCNNCQCEPASIYNHDYIEAAASPMATPQRKWLESPSTFLDRLCALEPGAVECRTYGG